MLFVVDYFAMYYNVTVECIYRIRIVIYEHIKLCVFGQF